MDIDEPTPATVDQKAEYQQQHFTQLGIPSLQPAGKQPKPGKKPGRRKGTAQRQQQIGFSSTAEQPTAETDEEDEVASESEKNLLITLAAGQQAGSEAGTEFGGAFDQDDLTSEGGELATQPPDPLYDPQADDEDEAWVHNKRQGRTSDAILSCPACFTTLCLECQQHQQFHEQYRAMFVMNCVADCERFVCPTVKGTKKLTGRKRGAGSDQPMQAQDNDGGDEVYHPVTCETCGTEVAAVNPMDDIKELQRQKEEAVRQKVELESLVKQMEQDAVQDAERSTEHAFEHEDLLRRAEDLREMVEQLSRQNAALVGHNSELKATLQEKEAEHEQILRAKETLFAENCSLQQQMETLQSEYDASMRDLQQQLDDLRSRVSAVVTRMLAKNISDGEAAEAVRALGCEIEYIEAPQSAVEQAAAAPDTPVKGIEWTGKTSLLLEDRERLQRLVVSGMMRNLAIGDKSTARIPVITFPTRNLPDKMPKQATPSLTDKPKDKVPAAIENSKPADNSHKTTDVSAGQRDQAASAGNIKIAIAKTTPAITATSANSSSSSSKQPPSAAQFMYSLQGGKGSSWVAKVPVSNPEPVATSPSFFSVFGGGSLMNGKSDDADISFSNSDQMGLVSRS